MLCLHSTTGTVGQNGLAHRIDKSFNLFRSGLTLRLCPTHKSVSHGVRAIWQVVALDPPIIENRFVEVFGKNINLENVKWIKVIHFSCIFIQSCLRNQLHSKEFDMGRTRSPNFPTVDLGEAVDAIKKIYTAESRGKFPQLSAASHLGYSSMNGRSLGVLAALRAYGLLEGRGDDLSVTSDAIAIIEAPEGSADRKKALQQAFNGPPMFNRILEQYPDVPSPQTLRWWLIQQGFKSDSVDKSCEIYLNSRNLAIADSEAYVEGEPDRDDKGGDPLDSSLNSLFNAVMPPPGSGRVDLKPPVDGGEQEGIAMGVHERVLQSGMLSKQATYKVIVSGPVGEAEIDKLIAKIEMDKDILAGPVSERNSVDDLLE